MTKRMKSAFLAAAVLAPSTVMAAGGESQGLPQLDITTWPSQVFWLVVVFAIGYVFISRMVTPKIGSVLEERRDRLEDDLGRAREASAEASQVRADYEAALESARNEAAEFSRKAANEAQQAADQANAKAAKKMATKVANAETKLAAARAEAEENLVAVATEAAMDTAKQLAGVKATKAQAEKAVKAAAKDLAASETN